LAVYATVFCFYGGFNIGLGDKVSHNSWNATSGDYAVALPGSNEVVRVG